MPAKTGDADESRGRGGAELRYSKWRHDTLLVLGTLYFRLFHRIQYYGCHNIPKSGPCLVVSNHPTYMDPVIVELAMYPQHVYWLAWDEIFDWPVFGNWAYELGAIPLNLEKPRAETLKRGLQVLKKGEMLGVFFEGGRSETFGLNPPRSGAASIALRTGTNILPVTISGAQRCWPLDQGYPTPGRMSVVYHPVIEVEKKRGRKKADEKQLTDYLEKVIGQALNPDGSAFSPRQLRRSSNFR